MTDDQDEAPISIEDEARILRLVSGECSAQEMAELRAWVASSPARRIAAEQLASLRVESGGRDEWNTEAALSKLIEELRAESQRTGDQRATQPARHLTLLPRPERHFWRRSVAFWSVAAALTIVGATSIVRVVSRSPGEPLSRAPAAVAFREFKTAPGQRATVTLHDGTRVALNVASSLKVPAEFGARVRDVTLEGEAFFEVAHDSARPFTVYAGNAATRVLGTRFDVRAYARDSVVEVVVAAGRVHFRRDDVRARNSIESDARALQSGVVLTAAMMGRVAGAAPPTASRASDTTSRLAWKEGRLVFHNTPLREALPQLSRWYAADFQLGNGSLGERRISATFADDPLTQVIRILEVALDARVVHRGETIVITARQRESR